MNSKFFQHPFWLVGFRPLFSVAFISGAFLPLIWSMIILGYVSPPLSGIPPINWHAHEMLFGFGWAVLGGFLLTASKNWLKIRGLHGKPLVLAFTLWILERLIIYFLPLEHAPFLIRFLALNSFILFVGGYVVFSLIRYRKQDTFSDNYFFVLVLPLFIVSKVFILSPTTFTLGTTMAIGLFRVAFAVMFERTITQFMKNTMKVELLRNKYLNFSIKILVMMAVFQVFMPNFLAIFVLASAATLLLIRFILWKPFLAFKRFEIGIMYVGYMGLVTHLYFEALRIAGFYAAIGSLSTHVFTFICMGLIIPSMLIRIAQGHTGRKLVFTRSDKLAIMIMGAGAFCRLVLTQIFPANYNLWIAFAASGWTLCFSILGFRLIPFLFQSRVDGRIH